jgi:hypothetical protein
MIGATSLCGVFEKQCTLIFLSENFVSKFQECFLKVAIYQILGQSKARLPDGFFLNQKSQIWVNFGGPLNGKCWFVL